MVWLKADSVLENTYRKIIYASRADVDWHGEILIKNNTLVLLGSINSLVFDFELQKVYANIIDIPEIPGNIPGIEGRKLLSNIFNLVLYIFGKWGAIPGIRVSHNYAKIDMLLKQVLKEINSEAYYSDKGIKFTSNGLSVVFEDIILSAMEKIKADEENEREKIEKEAEEEGPQGLWHEMKWKMIVADFKKSGLDSKKAAASRLGSNFYMVPYTCPGCDGNLHMSVYPDGKEFVIDTEEGKVYIARVYMCPACSKFYTPRPSKLLSEGDIYILDFEEDAKAAEDYKNLIGRKGKKTSNSNFNMYEADYINNVHNGNKSLARICSHIEKLKDEELERLLGQMDEGFYPENDIEKFLAYIEQELEFRRNNRLDSYTAFRKGLKSGKIGKEGVAGGTGRKRVDYSVLDDEEEEWNTGNGQYTDNEDEDTGESMGEGTDENDRLDEIIKNYMGTGMAGTADMAQDSEAATQGVDAPDAEGQAVNKDTEKDINNKKDKNIQDKNTKNEKNKNAQSGDNKKDKATQGIYAGNIEDKATVGNSNTEGGKTGFTLRKKGESKNKRPEASTEESAGHYTESGVESIVGKDTGNSTDNSIKPGIESSIESSGEYNTVDNKQGKEDSGFFRGKISALKNKKFSEIQKLLKEVQDSGMDAVEKEDFIKQLNEMLVKAGKKELDYLISHLPQNDSRERYKRVKERIQSYSDIDTSKYEEIIGKFIQNAERAELSGIVNQARAGGRKCLLDILESIKNKDYDLGVLKEYSDELYRQVKEIDMETVRKICPDITSLDVEDGIRAIQEIEAADILPELKSEMTALIDKRLTRMKTEESGQLVEKIRRNIENQIEDCPRIHYYDAQKMLSGDNTDAESLLIRKAISRYALLLGKYEYPVIICDSSLSGNGKDGFIVTPDHIFYKGLVKSGKLAVMDIENITFESGKAGKAIFVDNNSRKKLKLPCSLKNKDQEKLALILDEFTRYLKAKPKSRSVEYMSQKTHAAICCYRCGHVFKSGNICPKCGSRN